MGLSHERILELIKNFDSLPDDAVVPFRVIEAMGGPSARTLRRSPPAKVVMFTERCGGLRVGDYRALVRGAKPAA